MSTHAAICAWTGMNKDLKESVREFGSTWRWSVGAGVVLPTWVGRFEANYVAVLSAQVSKHKAAIVIITTIVPVSFCAHVETSSHMLPLCCRNMTESSVGYSWDLPAAYLCE